MKIKNQVYFQTFLIQILFVSTHINFSFLKVAFQAFLSLLTWLIYVLPISYLFASWPRLSSVSILILSISSINFSGFIGIIEMAMGINNPHSNIFNTKIKSTETAISFSARRIAWGYYA